MNMNNGYWLLTQASTLNSGLNTRKKQWSKIWWHCPFQETFTQEKERQTWLAFVWSRLYCRSRMTRTCGHSPRKTIVVADHAAVDCCCCGGPARVGQQRHRWSARTCACAVLRTGAHWKTTGCAAARPAPWPRGAPRRDSWWRTACAAVYHGQQLPLVQLRSHAQLPRLAEWTPTNRFSLLFLIQILDFLKHYLKIFI